MLSPRTRWKLALALLSVLLLGTPATSAESDDRRAIVGLKVFAAFVAADRDLDQRPLPEGELPLLLVHRGDQNLAREMGRRLEAIGEIRGKQISIHAIAVFDLDDYDGPTPAGLFITEWLADLGPVLRFAENDKVLVFSPFLGDVGRGVHGGLFVSDRILPLVDTQALERSGIRIKPFFLEVAKHHGDD